MHDDNPAIFHPTQSNIQPKNQLTLSNRASSWHIAPREVPDKHRRQPPLHLPTHPFFQLCSADIRKICFWCPEKSVAKKMREHNADVMSRILFHFQRTISWKSTWIHTAPRVPDVHHHAIINHGKILHGISYGAIVRRTHHKPLDPRKNRVPAYEGKCAADSNSSRSLALCKWSYFMQTFMFRMKFAARLEFIFSWIMTWR